MRMKGRDATRPLQIECSESGSDLRHNRARA